MASDAVVEAVAGALMHRTPSYTRLMACLSTSWLGASASGAGGGIVALLATYPLMTINTLQQTRGRRKRQEGAEELPPPRNVLAELKHVSAYTYFGACHRSRDIDPRSVCSSARMPRSAVRVECCNCSWCRRKVPADCTQVSGALHCLAVTYVPVVRKQHVNVGASMESSIRTLKACHAVMWKQVADRHSMDNPATTQLRSARPAATFETLLSSLWHRSSIVGTAVSQGVYFYLYSLLRDAAVARKHVMAGTVAAAGQASRTEELPASANLVVASLAGMGNVLVTNPIWRAPVASPRAKVSLLFP